MPPRSPETTKKCSSIQFKAVTHFDGLGVGWVSGIVRTLQVMTKSISRPVNETGYCLDSGQRSHRSSSTRGCKRGRAQDSLKVVGISFLFPLLDAASCLSASSENSIPLPSTKITGSQHTLSVSSVIKPDSSSSCRGSRCAGSGECHDDGEDELESRPDCEWDPNPSQICRTCSLSTIMKTSTVDRDARALFRLRSGGNTSFPVAVEHNATCARGNASVTSALADLNSFPSGYSPSAVLISEPRADLGASFHVAPGAMSDADHGPVAHLSQPLKTLRRLQQMLDATDYITSSPRKVVSTRESGNDKLNSVSRAGFTAPRDSQFTAKSAIERIARTPPLAPRNSPVIPPPPPRYPPPNIGQRGQETGSGFVVSPVDKLWTSKDKSKYRKQQSKLRRVQEELKKRTMSNISGKALERPSEFEDDTDDGLGYTLPSLPVYLSDAEGGESDVEDAEPSWYWSRSVNPPTATRSGSTGLSPPGGTAVTSQDHLRKSATEYANPDAKSIYHEPTQHHLPPRHGYIYYPPVFTPPDSYHPYHPAYGTVYPPHVYHPQPPFSPYAVYGNGPLREHPGSPSSQNLASRHQDISLRQPLQHHSPAVAIPSSFHPDGSSSQFHSSATPGFPSNTLRSSQTSSHIKSDMLATETETRLHGVDSQTMSSSPRLSRAAVEFRPLISRMHERDIQKTLPLIFSGAFRQDVPTSSVSHSRMRSDVMA
jgi:hypothetical protein